MIQFGYAALNGDFSFKIKIIKVKLSLHPDDAEELEDVWKPSPSVLLFLLNSINKKYSSKVIGRKIHQFLDMIKKVINIIRILALLNEINLQKIARAKGGGKKNRKSFRIGYKSNYIWEKLNSENKWEQKPKSMIKEKTTDKMNDTTKQSQVNKFIDEFV